MPKIEWIESVDFPSGEEFEYSTEFADEVAYRLKRQHRIMEGKSPSTEDGKAIDAFATLYAVEIAAGKDVISEDDVIYFIEDSFDRSNLSDGTLSYTEGRIFAWLQTLGWTKADTLYCKENSKWKDEDYLFVEYDGEGLSDLNEWTQEDFFLTRSDIENFFEERINAGPETLPNLVAPHAAAIETLLVNHGWVSLEDPGNRIRIWIHVENSYSALLKKYADRVEISNSDINDFILEVLRQTELSEVADLEIDASKLVKSYNSKLNTDGWDKIEFHNTTTWHQTDDSVEASIDESFQDYRRVIEEPHETSWEDEFDGLFQDADFRSEAVSFAKQNKRILLDHTDFDRETLEHNLRVLDYFIEFDEGLERMHGAETRGGKYLITDMEEEARQDSEKEDNNENTPELN